MEKKLSAISENLRRNFTANVSHELKTPITSISGYAEMMMTGLAPSEDLPLLAEKIYTEAQRLIALIDDGSEDGYLRQIEEYERIFGFKPLIREFVPSGSIKVVSIDDDPSI